MEDKEIVAPQEHEFIQEDDELIRIVRERQDEMKAAEQERLDTKIKCEAAKYQMHLKKVRHMYHNAARATATLAGACSVVTAVYLFESSALGVLITASVTFGLLNLTGYFDKRSRKKKGSRR